MKNTQPIVLVWTLLALIGVIIQTSLLIDSVHSLLWQQKAKVNGALQRVALGHFRSGLVYLTIHGLFLVIGIAVIWQLRWMDNVTSWFFIIAAVLLILTALADHRDRVHLRRSFTISETKGVEE